MDTIVAVASGPGVAGIAVLRISGAEADAVLRSLTSAALPAERYASLRVLRDAAGDILDRALVLRFAAGASFTGEPVVELHCHGGRAVVRAVLEAVLQRPGCRLAEPGEFTRRAFLNGRIDLVEVEALGDLIAAETEAQRRQAMRGFGGAVHARAEAWRRDLLRATALIEATIDWADEDVPEDVGPEVDALIAKVRDDIAAELAHAPATERLRHGFEVALVGAPNVGKSSLLNALAGREAAIASPAPGTTRDVIELRYDLDGLPVIFLDMAGLRMTDDPIEQRGVERAWQRARSAALRLFLAAPEVPSVGGCLWQEGDLRVWTKADLAPGEGEICVSAHTGEGIRGLTAAIRANLEGRLDGTGLVGHARQTKALSAAYLALVEEEGGSELRAERLREAAGSLKDMIGSVAVEDVLGEVFSVFCMGK